MARVKECFTETEPQCNVPEIIDDSKKSRPFGSSAIAIQYFACVTANLAGFVGGTILGWPTATITKLQDPNFPYRLTNNQIGWIMSILGLGSMIGPVITWLILDKIGRKSTLILSVVPMIASYVIMAIRTDYTFLLIGRCLAGAGVGMSMSTGPLYIGEIAENRVRGAMGVLGVISINCGCLFVYALGPHVTVSRLNLLCASAASFLTFLLLFIPESPYFYLIRGDTEKARSSLIWLRRTTKITTEFNAMKIYIEKKKMQASKAFDLVTKRGNRRAMTILVILQTMQPFSGSLAIPAYAYGIFGDAGYKMSLYNSVIMMGVVMLVASFGGIFLVDALGRRPVLFIGATVMAVCLMALGNFYTLQELNYDVSGISWIPFIAVMVYVAAHSCGVHSLPAILLSEYFSTSVKAKAAMVFTISLSLGGGASFKIFQLCYDALGFGFTFFICCAVLVISTIVLFFIMPETKGCSLQTIENMHSGETLGTSDIGKKRHNVPI